jgi:hypothetical protein
MTYIYTTTFLNAVRITVINMWLTMITFSKIIKVTQSHNTPMEAQGGEEV